jgi:hypothetical protein
MLVVHLCGTFEETRVEATESLVAEDDRECGKLTRRHHQGKPHVQVDV